MNCARVSARPFVFLALLATMACATSASQDGQQAGTKQQQNERATNTQSAAPEPQHVVIVGPVSLANEPDPKEEQRDAERRAQTHFENRVAIGTLFFAGVAAAGAIGAWMSNKRSADAAEGQRDLLKEQLKQATIDAEEQMRIATDMLKEAKNSATAANKSADVAKQTLIIANRAYLYVESMRLDNWNTTTPEVRFVVKNIGGLTATIIGWSFACSDDDPMPPIPDEHGLTHQGAGGRVTKDRTTTLSGFTDFFAQWDFQAWDLARQDLAPLAIWGIVSYNTGFPDDVAETRFVFQHDRRVRVKSPEDSFAPVHIAGYSGAT